MSRSGGVMPWLMTAAGCATVVCLVGWPLPTAFALCALTGLLALLAGVLKLRGELEHRPDGCGPECAEGHVYAYRCALKPPPVDPWTILGAGAADEQGAADGPLTGASTSSSNGCTACVGCGGPDCIQRADGVLAGADTAGEQVADASAHDHAAALVEQDERRQADAEAAAAAGDAARKMTCGHTISSVRSCCDPTERTLRAQLAAAYFDLALAIGHDRQPYPTAAAYTAACAALERHRQRADQAEQEQRKAAAVTEVWKANSELAAGQLEQARATIARVEDALTGLGPLGERHIRAALAAPVAQGAAEQPVSDPQQVDESADDSCQVVHVDGQPVLLRGIGEMDETTAGHFAEVIRAAKRRYAAEHPDGPPPPRRPRSATFRRLAAGLTGTVRDEHGNPICTCTTDARCPACLATDGES